MSIKRQDEVLKDLAEAIKHMRLPDSPSIRQASVEPYLDADGEAALKAVIVVDDSGDEQGWPAEFTHALRRQVNRLAAERHIDEHVYVTLFTQEEFESREDVDESVEGNSTNANRLLRTLP